MATRATMAPDLRGLLNEDTKYGVAMTASEVKENQFGLPLQHYAQQYLFGATGLRIHVLHSISGVPQSCKSPLLFDLMGHVCAPKESGGLGGVGVIYELEDKISAELLSGVLSNHGDTERTFSLMSLGTLKRSFKHMVVRLFSLYRSAIAPNKDVPILVGFDSIGGAANEDVVEKIQKEGVAGKGYYDKAHYMKYFSENISELIADLPIVLVCINQEKESASSTYGPPVKKITGGVSQVYKDGHMISTTYKTLASGDGKIITLRTTKTSFSDARRVEVPFRWNKFGDRNDSVNPYGLHFEWALASAQCLADPEKGVGEIRDICDVKVSDAGLVTCPTFGLRSVKPEEFEAALFSEENAKILQELYTYQKIDQLKGPAEFAESLKKSKDTGKEKAVKATKKPAAKKTTAVPLTEAAAELEAEKSLQEESEE